MENPTLLVPTVHVEVLLSGSISLDMIHQINSDVTQALRRQYVFLAVGQTVTSLEDICQDSTVQTIAVVDYTGPNRFAAQHKLVEVQLDVQTYSFKVDADIELRRKRRRITQQDGEEAEVQQARMIPLPNAELHQEWDSLIYDDGLPSQLLRYLTRMLGLMKQPGLNLSTFNWNRLCVLHGPAGSGKSTLCRALAQKLSIRLSQAFPEAILVEVNTNFMLSKYFGESGKLINALFDRVQALAQSRTTLVCVVMDEVETIAGSRERATAGGECSDGLRATNQLLTALDRVRYNSNVIVLCTSNLIEAIDPAFLDRVDIKQLIPSPSPAAIFNIFRSCLNELVRTSLVDVAARHISAEPSDDGFGSSGINIAPHSPENWVHVEISAIPTLPEVKTRYHDQPDCVGQRVWILSQECRGFSGRTLRRLPILGLAMYTWGGTCSLDHAITALESAVQQECMVTGQQKPVTDHSANHLGSRCSK